ncbi:TetM/TetW/TetO/TetS family tetracycline resistance ribosomal protection protein [Saccharibacillus sp. CPCC 101409]|uniref:GTP-binding protein n=1 Tax=Saccharibacillus sp. CPCC 101409 TaxID=3058041 RepID=UPI002673BC1B|nr:TetM/TetW/TetO/TetS family tetracycline resistance ribosomal protection protein [Saccharibacillus sp. CPCC 101409]MDO3410756.1 TetM/TetW/TetO/TetS family tetracycline resistance ribosomal protection protein [Saccharibacillus sp. CPCC 101409]
MSVSSQVRNIGVFAHIDAGKTTTTEYMLYRGGSIRTAGSVDAGTASTDSLDVERERGISVKAASASLNWKGGRINLIDTPGHADFLAEVERTLGVMDGAVLIVSAAESVQAQTEVLWQALRLLNVPTLIYINKLDRIGASFERTLADIARLLSPSALPVQRPVYDEDGAFAGIRTLWDGSAEGGESIEQARREFRSAAAEQIAEFDEELLLRYIEGDLPDGEETVRLLGVHTAAGRVYPVCCGCSQRGLGIEELLDAMIAFLPAPAPKPALAGIVFKVERDRAMGRSVWVRLYGGTLRNRDSVRLHGRETEEKITQIRLLDGLKKVDAGEIHAGDVAAVFGLSQAAIGDVIGDPELVPQMPELAVPLLTSRVFPESEADYTRTAEALRELTDEDPLLGLAWLPELRELHVRMMGAIQLEVLGSTLHSRFGLNVGFGPPAVIYKETPARVCEGRVAYLAPKPCWAILHFKIEPGERGSGLVYRSEARADDILPAYQNEVRRRVPEALKQGLYGWEVTDLRVTLTYGQHHVWHTHPLDFVIATPMGIMNGLASGGTRLLEPMLRFRISVPEANAGRVLSDLSRMRAEFEPPLAEGERFFVEGVIPAATSLDYAVDLRSFTGGKGVMTASFDGYLEAPEGTEASRTRVGVNPLDEAKYILSARSAL